MTHQPYLMLRTSAEVHNHTVKQTLILCPRCGLVMEADEGYLARGDYICMGVGADNFSYMTYADVPGDTMEDALTEPSSDEELYRSTVAALLALEHLRSRLDTLVRWYDRVVGKPNNP